MVSDRSKADRPVGEGEFRAITGIGPGIEKRLHDAGIHTFEHLGQLSEEEILATLNGLVGISAEKIAQQDWPAQARQIAQHTAVRTPGSTLPQPEDPEITQNIPQDRRYYESFVIELMMDEKRRVHRTRISHARSGEKNTWAGWASSRLTDWIGEQVGISARDYSLSTAQSDLTGQVQIASLQWLSTSELLPNHFLAARQPFEVRLSLDLSKVQARHSGRLACQVNLEAHRLGTRQRIHLGRDMQIIHIEHQPNPTLHMEEVQTPSANILPTDGLPEGAYRLEAIAFLTAEDDLTGERGSLQAIWEGELIYVLQDAAAIQAIG